MEFRKIKISQFFGRPDSKRDYGGGAGQRGVWKFGPLTGKILLCQRFCEKILGIEDFREFEIKF